MKIATVFVRVNTKAEYRHGEARLLESYLRFDAGAEHDLVIIDRYGESDYRADDAIPRPVKHLRYDGGGWDCGAWQFAGQNIDADLLACFNSSTYITGHGWLKRFVDAVETHGEGLYGPLTSNEIIPHVRTPCMIFQPHVARDYPREVQTRDDTYRFESMGWPDGTPNFTQWVRSKGLQTRLVTWDGCYDLPEWRTPPNVFRRGDQSNLIVKDRHCDAYTVSDIDGRHRLEGLADGK